MISIVPPAAPRVVELIRVSTDAQKEKATHEVQRQALDALRVARPGVVVKRLEALGVSGAKGVADRDDLKELLRLAASKAFDELRVFSVDRLTRSDDPRERFAVYGAARDAGATIIDCNGRVIDPADDSGMGEIDFYLQTMFAARERKKIMQRTMAGRKLKASQGKLSQGKAPYGRLLNPLTKTWETVPHEIDVYRRIIDSFLGGQSTRAIARTLNAARVPPPVRERWGKSTVLRMLKTPAIVGRYEVCGTVTQIPAVATPAEWERIQAMLKTNVSAPRGAPIPAILRQRLTCAACGSTVHVESDGAGSSPRYTCPRPARRVGSLCSDPHSARVSTVDDAVRAFVLEIATNPDALKAAVETGHEIETENPKRALDRLDKDLVKLAARESRTLTLLNDGLLSDDLARRELAGIKEARREAEERRAALRDTGPAPKPRDLVEAIQEAKAAVETASVDGVRDLLTILGVRVQLEDDAVDVRGRIPWGRTRYEARTSRRANPVPGAGVSFRTRLQLQKPAPQKRDARGHFARGAQPPSARSTRRRRP